MRCCRSLGSLCLAACVLIFAPILGQAQDYPSRPIRLIITSPAGSLVDVLGRLVAEDLGARLGQTVVVDNRPGAMTQVGSDFIAYAKANPGRVRYGSGGVGGSLHIAVEMLKLKTGADLVHVPYRGGSQAAADAISGQIEMVSMGLASARVAEGGKLRILAQTGPSRHPLFADVPTTGEFGLPDVRMDTWFGLIAPPNTPEPVVSQVARAIETGLQQQSFREKLFRIGCEAVWKSPADFAAFIAADGDKWSKLIPAMGISLAD
jgi:tripartite-type tricarboxylate transporter receptor subunit TctC